MKHTHNHQHNPHLTQTYGDQGLRFAGPDLFDYAMIFDISGGAYDGERLRIESAYHPCCGTLEVNASLFGVYKRYRNKLDAPIHALRAKRAQHLPTVLSKDEVARVLSSIQGLHQRMIFIFSY